MTDIIAGNEFTCSPKEELKQSSLVNSADMPSVCIYCSLHSLVSYAIQGPARMQCKHVYIQCIHMQNCILSVSCMMVCN